VSKGLFQVTWLLCLAEAALAQVEPAPPPRVNGYIQVRESYQEGPGLTATLNRARATVSGPLPGRFAYRLMAEFEAPTTPRTAAIVSLRDALVRWNHPRLAITAGQFKTPFSREYLTSITAVETADRAAGVDSLSPKRDVGVMAECPLGAWGGANLGVFNGEGQNFVTNRDSSVLVVGRVVLRPLSQLTGGASVAAYGADSARYGLEAGLEQRGWLLRGEYLRQAHRRRDRDDWGWTVLAGYRVVPWLQLVGRTEDYDRPSRGPGQRIRANTGGVNADLAGGAVRLLVNYVSREAGPRFQRTNTLIGQVQARF
jgi:phosphate-selective porin